MTVLQKTKRGCGIRFKKSKGPWQVYVICDPWLDPKSKIKQNKIIHNYI